MRQRRPLARRTPLRARPKEPVSRDEMREMAAFKQSIAGKRCVVCGKSEREAMEWARENLGYALGHQAHHAIRQQVLRRLGLPLWDRRAAVPVCEEPCHRQHTSRKRRIKRAELPADVSEFVTEYGLQVEFEREYPA